MHHRSESRSRHQTGGFHLDPPTGDRSHRHGKDGQLRKQTKTSKKALDASIDNGAPPEGNFIDIEFRSTSSKKASSIRMKELIGRDMSKELAIRQSSPCLVARLMGLDTLPPSVATHQPNERSRSCQKTPSVVFEEKYAAYQGYSCRTRTNEYQECKDVFEVTEKPKTKKHHNQPIPKVMSSMSESENVDSIKQKLMDAKCLSVNNAYKDSKEYHEALEGLGSNEDHFLNFLEEPNPLFKMHLQDLKCSPLSPHASNITILKSSKGTKYERSELSCKSEKYAERSLHTQKGDKNISRKYFTRPVNQFHNAHGQPLPCKLSDLQHTGKVREHHHPAQIVILKPSLGKAWGVVKTVPLARSTENDHTRPRRHKKVPIPRTSEFSAERRERSNSVEVTGYNTRSPRKNARKITGQMRSTGSSCSKEGSASKLYGSSFGMSGIKNVDSEFFGSTSDQLNDCSDNYKEARNRSSERWKTAHLVQEIRPIARRSSTTLREFFASSDRETQDMALYTTVVQNVSNGKVSRDEVSERRDFPLCISSKNVRMDGWSKNLPRSQPNLASSLVYTTTTKPSLIYQNHKSRRGNSFGGSERSYLKNVLNRSPNDANIRQQRTSSLKSFQDWNDQIYSERGQIQVFEQEIHVNSEELRDRIHDRHPRRNVSTVPADCNNSRAGKWNPSMVPEFCNYSFSGRGQLENLSQDHNHWKLPPVFDGQERKESAPLTKDAKFSCHDQNILMPKEASIVNAQVDLLSYQGYVVESSSQLNFKEVDEQNHLCALELLPSKKEKSANSLDEIKSDLRELWMQPKVLKFELSDTHADDVDILISSEDDNGDRYSFLKFGDILESFRDDEDRDFSYLLDLLVDSGLRHASQDNPSPECSVDPEVFERLETKYNMLLSWSRPERKLLFDLISSILVDLMAPSHNLHSEKPRWQPVFIGEDLVEKVWQILVKRRKEVSSKLNEQVLDVRWLDLGDDVDIVGNGLEKMIVEDLMEELYCQFL